MALPDIVFKHGSCNAAIFTKEITKADGQVRTTRSVSFQKRFRDKNGEWQVTSYLDVNDLPKAMLVLNKAYDYCTSPGLKQETDDDQQ